MLQNWKEYILNSFITVNGIRLSNSPIEGGNSRLKKLMKVSNGYGNFWRFRSRLMFCYSKELILTPVDKKIAKYPKSQEVNTKNPVKIDEILCL